MSRAVLLAIAVVAVPGCAEVVNPWADDVPEADVVTTASVEGVRAHRQDMEPPPQRVVSAERTRGSVEDGTVTHWPLWWEDPFVDKGSEDGLFAWTWEDYFAMPYGLGRFLVNTMGWPVSVAVQPPWTVMGSDGVLSRQALGYDHDAEPRPGGVEPPRDVLEIGTYSEAREPVLPLNTGAETTEPQAPPTEATEPEPDETLDQP
jgi:hypothetical protein